MDEIGEHICIVPGTFSTTSEYVTEWFTSGPMLKPPLYAHIPWWKRLSIRNFYDGRLMWPWDAWKYNPKFVEIEPAEYGPPEKLGDGTTYVARSEDIGKSIYALTRPST